MRKTVLGQDGRRAEEAASWLDLETIARVEVTSEDERFPVDHAFSSQPGAGWRAGQPGPQLLRLLFDEPQEIHRISLHIIERAAERMQEITISAEVSGLGRQELRRQQFTFSPRGSTEEFEEIDVELKDVTMLEFYIDPDRKNNPAESRDYASLASLRVS